MSTPQQISNQLISEIVNSIKNKVAPYVKTPHEILNSNQNYFIQNGINVERHFDSSLHTITASNIKLLARITADLETLIVGAKNELEYISVCNTINDHKKYTTAEDTEMINIEKITPFKPIDWRQLFVRLHNP